jgi:hypothetical protein
MNKFLVQRTLPAILIAAFLFSQTTVYAKHELSPDFAKSGKFFVFETYLRTELFFGTAKPDSSAVSEDEWKKFLADEVTPRFPDGFTVIAGDGQFRDKGEIIREKSFVLIVLYPYKTRRTSRRKIDEIREAYVKAFQQKSVMRVDFPQAVQVSF